MKLRSGTDSEMLENRSGSRNYSPFPRKGIPVRPEATVSGKNIATDEYLSSLYNRIQQHLDGEKVLSKFEVYKLMLILKKMKPSSPHERLIMTAAQTILVHINKQLRQQQSVSQEESKNSYAINNSKMEIDTSASTDSNKDINMLSQEQLLIDPMEEKENVPSNNIIKLNFNYAHSEGDSVSFPLELLTNVNFANSQEPAESGPGPAHQSCQSLESLFHSDMDNNLKRDVENADTITLTECDNTQYGCRSQIQTSIEESCSNQLNPPLEINNQVEYDNSSGAECKRISTNKPFDNNVSQQTDVLMISSYSADNSASIPEGQYIVTPNGSIMWETPESNIITSVQKQPLNSQMGKYVDNFKIPKNATIQSPILKYTTNLNNMNLSVHSIPDGTFPAATQPSSCNFVSERKENTKISQATNDYEIKKPTLPEMLQVNSDITMVHAVNDGLKDNSNKNEFSQVVVSSREKDPSQWGQNIIDDTPEAAIENNDLPSDGSFIFDLESTESRFTVIEATPLANHKRNGVKVMLPKKQPEKQSPSDMSIISQTPEIIIDETGFDNSESSTNQSSSAEKRGFSSPYRNQTQSSSLLNYKSNATFSTSLSFSRKGNTKMPAKTGYQSVTEDTNREKQQSENITFINGAVAKMDDNTICNSIEAETFAEKQKKLQEKVMKKRNAYRARWKDMPVSEKIRAKFADKFHVRIFEDPVDALMNIDYKPNFNHFHFDRLSLQEMHNQFKSSWEMTKRMDAALTKFVEEYVEEHNAQSVFNLRQNVNQSDSDSSDEEPNANKKWLMEYLARTKNESKAFLEELHKENNDIETVLKCNSQILENHDNEDKDEELEELLRKMGDCDWLKE